MARKRQEPKVVQEVVQAAGGDGEVVLEETGLSEDELIVGTLEGRSYTPGTMSAKAFTSFTLVVNRDGEEVQVPLEAEGKLASYFSLLNPGERVGVFVKDGLVTGVA